MVQVYRRKWVIHIKRKTRFRRLVLFCDSFSSAEEYGSAVCLYYLAHLPARLEFDPGWIVAGEGRFLLACAGVDGGGRWRRSGKVGAQRRNMGARLSQFFFILTFESDY